MTNPQREATNDTVPVPITGDDYYGEGKCPVCKEEVAIKVQGRFFDKVHDDLLRAFGNGFSDGTKSQDVVKKLRRELAKHAALAEAATAWANDIEMAALGRIDSSYGPIKVNLYNAVKALTREGAEGET